MDVDEKKQLYTTVYIQAPGTCQFNLIPNKNLSFFNNTIENVISSASLCCPGGQLVQIFMGIESCDVTQDYVDA